MRAYVSGLLLILTAVMMAACSTPVSHGPSTSPTPSSSAEATPAAPATPSASQSPAPRSIVVVGDSNSTGFSGTLENGLNAGTAWIGMLPPEQFAVSGGWAVDGATTSAMAAGAESVDAADLLVIMGGTNDLAGGAPFAAVAENLRRIVGLVGADAVAVAAIPPLDFQPAAATRLNEQLFALAEEEGWLFLDPWGDVRSATGTWMPEFRTDGVHTNVDGYAKAADAIAAQLEGALP